MECTICGCTDDEACFDENSEATCSWAAAGLCSFCANANPEVAAQHGVFPNLERAGFVMP